MLVPSSHSVMPMEVLITSLIHCSSDGRTSTNPVHAWQGCMPKCIWMKPCTGGYTIQVIFEATQSSYPSMDRRNKYRFRPLLGKKRQVLHSSRPCYQDCWPTGLLYASLLKGMLAQRSKGMSCLTTDLTVYA